MDETLCRQLRQRAEITIGAAEHGYAPMLVAEMAAAVDPEAVVAHGARPDHDGLRILALALRYAREPDPPIAWRRTVEDALRAVITDDQWAASPLKSVAYDLAADQIEIGPDLREQWDAWFALRMQSI